MSKVKRQELLKQLETLEEDIKKIGNKNEFQRKHEIMELMHKYNSIKDATQVILGALAELEGVTVKEIHLKYKLPLIE